jgi:hypothetical protein
MVMVSNDPMNDSKNQLTSSPEQQLEQLREKIRYHNYR